jgi:hypothetical protein
LTLGRRRLLGDQARFLVDLPLRELLAVNGISRGLNGLHSHATNVVGDRQPERGAVANQIIGGIVAIHADDERLFLDPGLLHGARGGHTHFVPTHPDRLHILVASQIVRDFVECIVNLTGHLDLHLGLWREAEFSRRWREHLGARSRDVLIIAGLGFDPRTVSVSQELIACGGGGKRDLWLLCYDNGQQTRIFDRLQPDQICPVVPFPTREPRRGDRIIESHQRILFDEFNVEPRNILYASEYNPFEAYREVFMTIDRYRDALVELGDCRVFVSPLSSKLLSVSALLACYDHKRQKGGKFDVGIPYVEVASYGPSNGNPDGERTLTSMWLTGEWEEAS